MLESFESPEQPTDYKLFVNVCDLFSGILSLKWTHEWIVEWIKPLLLLVLEGRRKFFNALGYLKILETILKCLKKVGKEKLIFTIDTQELIEIEKIIIELLSVRRKNIFYKNNVIITNRYTNKFEHFIL